MIHEGVDLVFVAVWSCDDDWRHCAVVGVQIEGLKYQRTYLVIIHLVRVCAEVAVHCCVQRTVGVGLSCFIDLTDDLEIVSSGTCSPVVWKRSDSVV